MSDNIRPLAKVAATAAGYYYGGPVGAMAASTAFDALLPEKKPELPQASPVPTMPTPNDEAVRAARKRSLASQSLRRGRASTILTAPAERLGD